MAGENEPRVEPVAWDRFGRFLEDMGTVTQSIWKRNLDLWNEVAERLRTERYTADAMADDTAKAMATALDNADDIWSFWTRVPEREQVAGSLPTAFLFFPAFVPAPGGEAQATHSPPDPVWIRVPSADVRQLPATAEIVLSGPSKEGAEAVRRCLAATLKKGPAYLLEPHEVERLVPGVYDGVVYITEPPRPLANLRVVVEEPAAGR